MTGILGRTAGKRLFALVLLTMVMRQAAAADLAVSVTGVRSDDGVVRICAVDAADSADFPDCLRAPADRRAAVPAHRPSVSATFRDVKPGLWALSAYHDTGNDGFLRRNLLGIPREGVGASRDPRRLFGPPSFEQAAVQVGPAGGAVSFALVYP